MSQNIPWPSPPSNPSPEAAWHRKLLECCKRLQIKDGTGYRVAKQDEVSGTILSIAPGSGLIPSSIPKPYIITGLNSADYFTAKSYNWTSKMAQGSEVSIAKAITGRGPTSQQIDGNTVEYTYALNRDNLRSAQIVGIVSQWQVMNPRYLQDDGTGLIGNVIFACEVQGGTGVLDGDGNPVALQEFHSRNWVYQWNQSGTLP